MGKDWWHKTGTEEDAEGEKRISYVLSQIDCKTSTKFEMNLV